MSEEKLNAFYELINGFEIVGSLTDEGKKFIKDGVQHLQQENKQLKEELQKADSITQSCIFEGKEESTINFRECLKQLELYKEVIEEVRALHKKFCTKHGIIVFENNELIEFMNNLIDTLNKAKENK